jgi:hypothetical protein
VIVTKNLASQSFGTGGKRNKTNIILVINQLNAQNLFIISLLYASTCFEHYVLIVRKSKLYYTASGIITLVGGRPVRRLRADSLHGKATYRCDDIKCCIIQF